MRELRDKYGATGRSTVNRAIRAECPGGDVALDHLAAWYQICRRLGWGAQDGHDTPLHVTAYRHLLEIVDEMEKQICLRYNIPQRRRNDLAR